MKPVKEQRSFRLWDLWEGFWEAFAGFESTREPAACEELRGLTRLTPISFKLALNRKELARAPCGGGRCGDHPLR